MSYPADETLPFDSKWTGYSPNSFGPGQNHGLVEDVQGQDDSLSVSLSSHSSSMDVSEEETYGKMKAVGDCVRKDMQSIVDLIKNTQHLPLATQVKELKVFRQRWEEIMNFYQEQDSCRSSAAYQEPLDPAVFSGTSVLDQRLRAQGSNGEPDDRSINRNVSCSESQDRPIKSFFRGRTFEERLDEQLTVESKKQTSSPSPAVTVKRPFLKRGQGLARFTRGKAAVAPHKKVPAISKQPSPCPSSRDSQKPHPKANQRRAESSKPPRPAIQRKTAVLNKENQIPSTKSTGPSRVLGAGQDQNLNTGQGEGSSVEDHKGGQNSFEVWYTERGALWDNEHHRESAELGEFELLEQAVDETSFSSTSSFMKTLLQRDNLSRRLSSTPIKSANHCAPSNGQSSSTSSGSLAGRSPTVCPANAVLRDAVRKELPKEPESEISEERFREDGNSCSSGPVRTVGPISYDFQAPAIPYDKCTYQDSDGGSEEDNREELTLVEPRPQMEFDDEDTWNEPDDVFCSPEASSHRPVKKKVSFSAEACTVNTVRNENEAPPINPLIAKMFPALKPKPRPLPVTTTTEPKNLRSEDRPAQSMLLRERLVELETEIERFKLENAELAKLKQENQETRDTLRKEKAEFEKMRMEETARWEEHKREENKKFQREKKIFEKHASVTRERPNKQERDEIQALKQQLHTLQEDVRKRETRWSTAHNRLRQHLDLLTNENASLQEQVRVLEKLRISDWKSVESKREEGRMPRNNSATKSLKEAKGLSQSNGSMKGSSEAQDVPTDTVFLTETNGDVQPLPCLSDFAASDHSEDEQAMMRSNKMEKLLPGGGRLVLLPNGTKKQVSADEQTVKVTYFNGDVKHTMPDKRVIYFHAEAQTTHTTYPDGMQVIQFSNNQTEKHFPDGRKEITFPDQTVKMLFPDGREESVLADGTIMQTDPDGGKVITFINGQREVHTAEFKRREYPDGTVKTIYCDGRQETRYPSGGVRLKDPQGRVVTDTPP